MVDRALIFSLVALCAANASAQLQLTPQREQYELDGVKLEHLVFPNGETKATYSAPHGWDYSGSATQLVLHPPKKVQAEATITRVPLAPPGSFDEEQLTKLTAEATALVPKGSEKITIISQDKSPLAINGQDTFLVVIGYNYYGQEYRRSILFLNRATDQIRFQLTCRAPDFDELQRAFMQSQYSWQNI